MSERDEGRARRAVEAEMADRRWDVANLVEAARLADMTIDAGTVGDFLNGKRWPRRSTRGTIEKLFDWAPGRIEDLAAGVPADDVRPASQDDEIRYQRPPGMSDREWELRKRTADATLKGLFAEYEVSDV